MNSLQYRRKAIVLGLMVLIASADFSAVSGQDKPNESEAPIKKGLRLSAELDGEMFKPQSVVTLKLKLENTGKSPVYIYKELGFGPAGFGMTILDASDNWVPPRIIRDTFPAPVLAKEDLQAIKPGKAIEEKIRISLSNYEMVPGDYTLKIEYISPVAPSSVTRDLAVLTSDDGPLEAKAIRFKILVPSP